MLFSVYAFHENTSSLLYYSQLFATFVGLINVEFRQADKAFCLFVLRNNRDETTDIY